MKKAAAKQLFLFKGFDNANNHDNFSERAYAGHNGKIAAIVEYSGYDFKGLAGAKKGIIPIRIVIFFKARKINVLNSS